MNYEQYKEEILQNKTYNHYKVAGGMILAGILFLCAVDYFAGANDILYWIIKNNRYFVGAKLSSSGVIEVSPLKYYITLGMHYLGWVLSFCGSAYLSILMYKNRKPNK